jgi:hypothetical protein
MVEAAPIRQRCEAMGAHLDERGRRLLAATEVRTAGWGGLAMVSAITGIARSTINRGQVDLDAEPLPKGRLRRAGGGRRALCDTDPGLIPALKRRVEPATLGDPMRPLIWVSNSREKLAAELTLMGHPIGPDTVGKELVKLGFSRQFNRKADEGSHHPDRNARFEHINAKVIAAPATGQPVISVDTKKKERIGNFKNGGTDYCPKGKPRHLVELGANIIGIGAIDRRGTILEQIVRLIAVEQVQLIFGCHISPRRQGRIGCIMCQGGNRCETYRELSPIGEGLPRDDAANRQYSQPLGA